MKRNCLILLASSFLLVGCTDNNQNNNDSSSGNTSSESINVSSNESETSSSSEETIVKKELSVDNIYNDFLALANDGNFTIEFSRKLKDVYTNDYVLKNSSETYYFKGNSIYQEASKGVYTATKENNVYKLGHLVEGEDEDGYPSDSPLTDFHTINLFSYLNNPKYGASKEDLSLSSNGEEITVDYSSSGNNVFSILALMFGNYTNVYNGVVNHASIKYDEENNIVVEFSKFENNAYTYPSDFAKGTIKNINNSSDETAESFLKTIDGKIGGRTFTYYNTYSIRNTYLSTTTSLEMSYVDGSSTYDLGTYELDYNPNKIHIKSSSGETFINRSSSGAAYIQGINALNEVCDDTYYAQTFSNLDFGYKDFDFEGFRYDEDEDAYLYYGLNGGNSLNSITYLGLTSTTFDSIKLYVDPESEQISKIIAKTSLFLTEWVPTKYKYAYYTFTIDLVDYRTIGEPSIYGVKSNTAKIQTVFNKVNDYENTSFKTVAKEWYEGKDSKDLQPIVTTYYTQDYVYKQTTITTKNGNSYTRSSTGRGQYAIKDEEGNVIGVKEFRVTKDNVVEPRSEILYGKTLKDYWINISASPLVFDLKDNVISPVEGMNGNKFKDYLPISHSRFEAQEGSMQNGGDYGVMSFTLNDETEDEISEFNYTYGVQGIFEADYSGKGVTTFTYSSESNPVKIDDSLISQLETMGTFKTPTKWSESQSSEIYPVMKSFFEGKKNRYGEEVDVDRDIPFLFDDDLDASWIYSIGQLKNTKNLNIRHNVESFDDGDINNYNAKYETLLQNDSDYTYTSESYLNYYVNGDIVIAMTNSAMGGIYFYTAIPQYN